MSIIDLSHSIAEGMPVYPGTEPPVLSQANTLAEHGFREKLISMYSHTGTHMDAPAHILPEGYTLDQLPVETFVGDAFVFDATGSSRKSRDRIITVQDLQSRHSDIASCDFLILRSGWDRLWGDPEYFKGYPVLSEDAADWLAARKLKGLGLDCISADPAESFELPVHRIILGAGMVIIENLCNLAGLSTETFRLYALPLKIQEADGSPLRVVGECS